ncbi:MAG: lysophospholipid acyltransferase family protein [Candidatus Krumholzibacteriia bacterium]
MPTSRLPRWRRWRRRAYYLVTVGLLAVAGRVPVGPGRALGRCLARAALVLRPRERRRARANLALALPEHDEGARRALLAASARRLGENLHDTLAAPRLLGRPGFVVEEPCAATGGRPVGEVVAALGEAGRGVLILTGHLGCWELLGGWLARELPRHGAGPLAVVTGTVHNPGVDRLLQRRRQAAGLRTLPRDGGAAPLLRHLGAGGTAAVLLDQRLAVPSLPVPFFGRPAPTAAGFGRLVLRRGVPVLPVAIGRLGGGHVVRHLAPLLPPPDPAAARDDARVAAFLAACNGALEEMVRRNPAEWVWFHPRWTEDATDAMDPTEEAT